MIMVVMAMIISVMGSVLCDRVLMTAATAAAGGFRFDGVVVDRQGGSEIGFHAAIQNPKEASGSSPRLR
jgi:hypothetical protein